MNYLVLLRHGQSQWNLENHFTGFRDIDLTPEGEIEARNAGKKLYKTPIRFDAVFTSTLKRANRTARIALENAGQRESIKKGMIAHDALRERDYGELTGLDKDETRRKYGVDQVKVWRRSYDVAPQGGESLKDVVERVRPYYNQNIRSLLNKGESVLVAAHGNSLRAMLIILGVETPETISEAEIPTGAPLVFEMVKGKIKKRYFLE